MAITVTTLPDGRKRVFITSGTTQWPDPGDWNPENNTIEVVAGGGRGQFTGAIAAGNGVGGPGGGGGGYGVASNVALTFPVSVTVDAVIGWGQNSPTNGTNFGDICHAGRGGDAVWSASGGFGTPGAAGVPAGYAGGGGGTGFPGGAGACPGGGGGGAAGPSGAGGNGVNGASATSRAAGGSGDGGTVAGGADTPGAGASGSQWESYGVGGGGSGGMNFVNVTNDQLGGNGGLYGGGGGGGFGWWNSTSIGQPGAGQPGLIVVTYMPLVPAPQAIVQVIG